MSPQRTRLLAYPSVDRWIQRVAAAAIIAMAAVVFGLGVAFVAAETSPWPSWSDIPSEAHSAREPTSQRGHP